MEIAPCMGRDLSELVEFILSMFPAIMNRIQDFHTTNYISLPTRHMHGPKHEWMYVEQKISHGSLGAMNKSEVITVSMYVLQ